MGHATQISSKTSHELSFMPSFLLVHSLEKLTSWPLTFTLVYSLSSHVYFNVHTLMVGACIGSGVS